MKLAWLLLLYVALIGLSLVLSQGNNRNKNKDKSNGRGNSNNQDKTDNASGNGNDRNKKNKDKQKGKRRRTEDDLPFKKQKKPKKAKKDVVLQEVPEEYAEYAVKFGAGKIRGRNQRKSKAQYDKNKNLVKRLRKKWERGEIDYPPNLPFEPFKDRIEFAKTRLGLKKPKRSKNSKIAKKYGNLIPEEFDSRFFRTPVLHNDTYESTSTARRKRSAPGLPPCVKENGTYPYCYYWDILGCMSPVYDQGDCGSCYAFATMEALETMTCTKTGVSEYVSTQHVVDCSVYTNGCGGGLPYNVFWWMFYVGKQAPQSEYQYIAAAQTCKENDRSIGFFTTQIVNPYSWYYRGESSLGIQYIDQLLKTGPVIVGVWANNYKFLSYTIDSGILEDCTPDPDEEGFTPAGTSDTGLDSPSDGSADLPFIDHAVVVIGDGIWEGTEFYIIQNSWGINDQSGGWGDRGQALIKKGACGIGTYVVQPDLGTSGGN